MDFADLDNDGQPDSSTTGNANGGRASYIHYVEPFPVLVDASHLGLGAAPRHVTFLATEVLTTTHGTGLVYVLDTTDYEMLRRAASAGASRPCGAGSTRQIGRASCRERV